MAQAGVLLTVHLMILSIWLCAATSKDNTCTFYQNGCKYQVTLSNSECMVSDGVDLSHLTGKSNIITTTTVQETPDESHEEISAGRLDDLERKLTKMMEGLSVRSLRHIRQIRNDLRQMSNTMSQLRSSGGRVKRKRDLGCPEEFIGVGKWNSCYRFSTFNATWHEAREYCSAFGANLVALDTLQESYIMDYLIKSHPDFELPKGWWTSGNYIVRHRKWMWTSKLHLKQMTYSRWAPGEPDARSTMHCMLLYKHAAYRWHDAMCTDRHNFICEIEDVY